MSTAPEAGKYTHYKGGLYEVLMIGEDSETRNPVVIYRSIHTGKVWVRPVYIWNTPVQGKERFTKCT